MNSLGIVATTIIKLFQSELVHPKCFAIFCRNRILSIFRILRMKFKNIIAVLIKLLLSGNSKPIKVTLYRKQALHFLIHYEIRRYFCYNNIKPILRIDLFQQ